MAAYFSASDRATALAQGVALLAIVQNMPGSAVAGSAELHEWDAWQVTYGLKMTATAREFQREMMTSAIHGDWQ